MILKKKRKTYSEILGYVVNPSGEARIIQHLKSVVIVERPMYFSFGTLYTLHDIIVIPHHPIEHIVFINEVLFGGIPRE